MTPDQLNAWIVVASVLVNAGAAAVEKLKAIFSAGGLTEEQQAEILAALADDNRKRRAISAAIAGIQ